MHSFSKHMRHGVVAYLHSTVPHSVCFYAVNDCREC